MPHRPLKIVYFTAGAAGMICGSCLHDNALARALLAEGHDVQLIPLYTPIRTDEEDISSSQVFLGGINMYLQQKVSLFRWLPRWMDRWLDQPWLINWAAGRSVKIDPPEVADLTLSILRGSDGNQRKEVLRLVEWLGAESPPDVLIFTNILTAGCVPEIKRRLKVPIVVTLQGDDIFLRGLPEPYQAQALAEIRRLSSHIDGYIANSQFYADAMAEFLGLDRDKIHVVPLGIDTRDYHGLVRAPQLVPTIGYLARLAPEKGLQILAEPAGNS
jgi:glycosyltransferase involved in cell wall biosynthesis